MTIEEIQKQYAEKCARLGEAVYNQRKLHVSAEQLIREIEKLEQDARGLAATPTESAPTEAPVTEEK